MLSTIEKVLLLQELEIFDSATTEQLGQIALITEEIEYAEGNIIYQEGDGAHSLYIVIDGKVRIHQGDNEIMIALPKSSFGVWALFDEEERVVTATCLEDTSVLCLEKENFYNLLADYSGITRSILRAMSQRLRRLLGKITNTAKND